MILARLFGPCFWGHSPEWTRVVVDGVWHRCCSRCQQPLGAILAHRGEQEDITAAKVPAITVRHAIKAKQAKRPSKSLRWPRKVS